MSAELLQGLLDDYKNSKDKAAMMAGRSLLGLYREINPEMLRKKDRGKGASISLKDFKAPTYGEVKVMDTIDGADLLLEAGDDDSDAPDLVDEDVDPGEGWEGWEVESLSDQDDVEVPEEEDGPSRKKRKTVLKTVVVGEDGEEVDADNGDEADWEDEDENDGDDHEDEDGNEEADEEEADEVEEDEDEEEEETPAARASSSAPRIAPKTLKLQAQKARREGEANKNAQISEETKQKFLKLSSEKIFTDEEFAKMRRLAQQRKAEQMAGVKRSRAQLLLDEDNDSDEDSDENDDVDGVSVPTRRIMSGLKKKQTAAEGREQALSGRESHTSSAALRKAKKEERGGSTTNREKSKRTKNFVMIAHKRSVKGKQSRSLKEKRKVLRDHITKIKKKGF